ncbi:argonaute 2-like protein [Tanacetum coccineum]
MENPLIVREACMGELSSLSKVRALLSSVIEESGKIDEEPLQLVFCVMADRGFGYERLKWVSKAEIGVLTQCCLSENANKSTSQFLANLSVVGSVNPHSATRYTARMSLQSPSKEEIVNFAHMCLELVNAYGQMNGMKPKKIVMFRDGVSTVVNAAMVHPFEIDFYLCSHFGPTGTSKPTRYTGPDAARGGMANAVVYLC